MTKLPLRTSAFLLLGIVMPVCLLHAQNAVSLETEAAGSIDWIAEIMKGGTVSAVLILTAFISLVFIIERLLVVRTKYFVPQAQLVKVKDLAKKMDFPGIERTAKNDNSTLGEISRYIAFHTHVPFEILTIGVSDMISRMVSRQRQKTYPLLVIATISPLLGLLGTIIGMIESFQKVALMGDTGDAAILADSIGKALITTALGLIIAIPSLAAYHFFKSRINSFGIALEESVDYLTAAWLRPEETTPEEASSVPVEPAGGGENT